MQQPCQSSQRLFFKKKISVQRCQGNPVKGYQPGSLHRVSLHLIVEDESMSVIHLAVTAEVHSMASSTDWTTSKAWALMPYPSHQSLRMLMEVTMVSPHRFLLPPHGLLSLVQRFTCKEISNNDLQGPDTVERFKEFWRLSVLLLIWFSCGAHWDGGAMKCDFDSHPTAIFSSRLPFIVAYILPGTRMYDVCGPPISDPGLCSSP